MARFKAVRTDRELECAEIDEGLRAAGCELAVLPDGIGEDELVAAVRDADILLMCYTPVTARVIEAAPQAQGHRQIRRRHRRDRRRGGDGARHSGGERAGVCRGNGRRRRLRADDCARQEADADRSRNGDDRLGLADRAMDGARSRRPHARDRRHRQDRAQHGAHGRGLPHAGDRVRSACAGGRDAGSGHREGRRPRGAIAERATSSRFIRCSTPTRAT